MKYMATLFAVTALVWLSGGDAAAQHVRVRLLDLDEPVTIAVSAHGGSVRLYAAEHEDPLIEIDAGARARVTRVSNQLHVNVGDLGLYAASLRAEPAPGAHFGIQIEEESASPGDVRTYAGRLLINIDGSDWEVQLVNDVPLEDYVASVVASEYGFDDLEGSKAMAVIVRTYTLDAVGRFGSDYDHVDHTLSQVYQGLSAVTPAAREATRATEGEVLTHDGELVRAVYFSSSGGHTADNEAVWEGEALPYLRGKPDPYGQRSPHASWTTRIDRNRLLAALREAYGVDVDGFLIDERSGEGRVATIDLLLSAGGRRTVTGNDFRLVVSQEFGPRSVRSTLFDAHREGEEYVFEGRGFGHGVGLSQWGAHDMAQRGMPYTRILDFYYDAVSLASLDAPDSEPTVIAHPPIRQVSDTRGTPSTSRPADPSADADAASPRPAEGLNTASATSPQPDGASSSSLDGESSRATRGAADDAAGLPSAEAAPDSSAEAVRPGEPEHGPPPRPRRRIGW